VKKTRPLELSSEQRKKNLFLFMPGEIFKAKAKKREKEAKAFYF